MDVLIAWAVVLFAICVGIAALVITRTYGPAESGERTIIATDSVARPRRKL